MNSRKSLYIIGSILLFLAILVFFDKVFMPWFVGSSQTIQMPSIQGKSKEVAVDMIESQGLIVEEVIEKFSPTVAKGIVLSQMPYAGAIIKQGRRVYLVVSKGYEVVTVPDLSMMTKRDVEIALRRAELLLGTSVYNWKDSVPEDRVIEQSVAPGLSVVPGTSINIVLSKDSTNTVVLPSYIRLSLDDATRALETIKVNYSIRTKPDDTMAEETVIGQSPGAGTRVKLGSSVQLTISRKPSIEPQNPPSIEPAPPPSTNP